jgi:hypothetical protein
MAAGWELLGFFIGLEPREVKRAMEPPSEDESGDDGKAASQFEHGSWVDFSAKTMELMLG